MKYMKFNKIYIFLTALSILTVTCDKFGNSPDSGSIRIQIGFSNDSGNVMEKNDDTDLDRVGHVNNISISIEGMEPINIDVEHNTTILRTIDGVPLGNLSVKVELKNAEGSILYTQVQWVDVRVDEVTTPEFPAEEFSAQNVEIKVISPNGGGHWEFGSTESIAWSNSHSGINVDIYLHTNQGDLLIVGGLSKSLPLEYSWVVGQGMTEASWTNGYKWYDTKIKVEYVDTYNGIEYFDMSDEFFSLHAVDECEMIEAGKCDCLGNIEDCMGECGGAAQDLGCGCDMLGAEEGYDCDGYCIAGYDCLEVCGGTAESDNCGVCDSDPTNNNTTCTSDCNGEDGGDASIDECDVCSGGNTGHLYNSDMDVCFVCDGDGSTCCDNVCTGETPDCDGNGNCYCAMGAGIDCEGMCGGNAVLDECGTCDDDVSNDCVQDCAGIWGGPSVLGGCDIACGSELVDDACGVCGGDGSDDVGCGCFEAGPDACGVCGGTATSVDECDPGYCWNYNDNQAETSYTNQSTCTDEAYIWFSDDGSCDALASSTMVGTIKTPNSGDTYSAGNPLTIEWNIPDTNVEVNIVLYHENYTIYGTEEIFTVDDGSDYTDLNLILPNSHCYHYVISLSSDPDSYIVGNYFSIE